jgi:2-polyprenyl-3-methyl-5-hydroxy-6-metoxy-1,4-benzoquinol methylase
MNDADISQIRCIACGGELYNWGIRSNYHYFCCSKCKSLQQVPFPTQEELDRLYRMDYTSLDNYQIDTAKLHRPIYQKIVDIIKRSGYTEKSKIIDFGCGWGGMCEILEKEKFDYLGVDLSEEEIQSCRDRNLNCMEGGMTDLAAQNTQADVIISTFVFEHLVNYEEFFNSAKSILKVGGIMIIVIPTSPLVRRLGKIHSFFFPKKDMPQFGETISPPWHTVVFSPLGVRNISEKNGFRVIDVIPCPKYKADSIIKSAIKVTLGVMENIGCRLMKWRWPISTANIFVLKDIRDQKS